MEQLVLEPALQFTPGTVYFCLKQCHRKEEVIPKFCQKHNNEAIVRLEHPNIVAIDCVTTHPTTLTIVIQIKLISFFLMFIEVASTLPGLLNFRP